VIGMPSMIRISSTAMRSLRTITPSGHLLFGAMSSMGHVLAIHGTPYRAAAVWPAMMPRRPLHNHAAAA
jgi:hypothetical protein